MNSNLNGSTCSNIPETSKLIGIRVGVKRWQKYQALGRREKQKHYSVHYESAGTRGDEKAQSLQRWQSVEESSALATDWSPMRGR